MSVSMTSRVLRSPYPDLYIPPVHFGQTFFSNMTQCPGDVTAAIDTTTRQHINYAQFIDTAETIARHLIGRLGCRQNDVIAIYSPNCVEWTLLVAAAWRAGAIPCACNNLLTAAELRSQIQLSKPRFLFTVDSLADNALAAGRDCLDVVIVHHSTADVVTSRPGPADSRQWPCRPTVVEYKTMLDPNETPLPSFDELKVDAERAVALILFSSGTTGAQKAVLLSHTNLQSQLAAVCCADGPNLQPKHNLVFAPFAAIIGFTFAMCSLAAGNTLHIIRRFQLDSYLRYVSHARIECLFLVPAVVSRIIDQATAIQATKLDLSCVKHIVTGGSILDRTVEDKLLQCMPGLQSIRQAYGMTEMTGAICATTLRPFSGDVIRSHGSTGVPVNNTLIKVVSPQTGEALTVNEVGEVCIKSPAVMLGYLDNAAATAATIDQDGWLHTGDIGYYDTQGQLTLVDRLKELIKYNSFQVAPAELEALLVSHPAVSDAAVIGVADSAAGQLPMACVVLKQAATVTAMELQRYVAARVAPYKQLRGGVQFVTSLPRTPSGKLQRQKLRQQFTTRCSKL